MNMLTVNLLFSTLVFAIVARLYLMPRLREFKPSCCRFCCSTGCGTLA